jgi:hypothetical protein
MMLLPLVGGMHNAMRLPLRQSQGSLIRDRRPKLASAPQAAPSEVDE